MNTKTPGQIAFEAAPPHKLQWSLATDKAEWEMIAAAVIAHHEAQNQPQPKFKVGDHVLTNSGQIGVVTNVRILSETIVTAQFKRGDYSYRQELLKPTTLPPTHKITINLPPITLTSGKFSLAAI